jgi:hypothetical protein
MDVPSARAALAPLHPSLPARRHHLPGRPLRPARPHQVRCPLPAARCPLLPAAARYCPLLPTAARCCPLPLLPAARCCIAVVSSATGRSTLASLSLPFISPTSPPAPGPAPTPPQTASKASTWTTSPGRAPPAPSTPPPLAPAPSPSTSAPSASLATTAQGPSSASPAQPTRRCPSARSAPPPSLTWVAGRLPLAWHASAGWARPTAWSCVSQPLRAGRRLADLRRPPTCLRSASASPARSSSRRTAWPSARQTTMWLLMVSRAHPAPSPRSRRSTPTPAPTPPACARHSTSGGRLGLFPLLACLAPRAWLLEPAGWAPFHRADAATPPPPPQACLLRQLTSCAAAPPLPRRNATILACEACATKAVTVQYGNTINAQCACPTNHYGDPVPGGTCTACPVSTTAPTWVSLRPGATMQGATRPVSKHNVQGMLSALLLNDLKGSRAQGAYCAPQATARQTPLPPAAAAPGATTGTPAAPAR